MRIEENNIPREMKKALKEILPSLPVQTKRFVTDASKKENVRHIVSELHKEDPSKRYKTSIVKDEIFVWRTV